MTEELHNDSENEEMEPVPASEEIRTRPLPYANDPAYGELLKHYQNADWNACLPVVESLLQAYPEDENLLEFKQEIEMRNSLLKLSLETESQDRRENLKKIGIRVLIGFGIFAVVLIAAFWAYNSYQARVAQRNLEIQQTETASKLAGMYENAQNLLDGGRADEALELFLEIQAEDPEYEGLAENIAEAESLIALEAKYVEANRLYADGDLEGALEIFREIVEEDQRYKDASLLVTQIENTLKINELMIVAENAFGAGEWKMVVETVDQILEIDATADISSLDLALFTSYLNLVIETASKADVTLEDVDKAYEYYRKALAIFPQDREFENERAELQRTAISLLANKYLLYAKELLETENYSQQAVEQALSFLNRANNIGSGSEALESEIRVLQLYLSILEDFNNFRWDSAISSLEQLKRTDENYANGMVAYLLYEAYLSRGTTLSDFGEYTLARSDFDQAEIYARGDSGNLLRIFSTQIAVGANLRRLSLTELAANIYRFAANQVHFVSKLGSDYPDQLNAFYEAEAAYAEGDYWNAARLYEIALEDTSMIYETTAVTVTRGTMIGQVAFQNGSSIGAILQLNPQLGENLVVRSDMEIQVPTLAEDQN